MSTDNVRYESVTDQQRQAVLVRSEIERLTHNFFFDQGFIYVEPPVLHEAIANKKSDIYVSINNINYTLTSSNALFMGTYAGDFKKVFTISKCFRNEVDTKNHLIEFNILEAELLDCKLDEMIQLVLTYLKFILSKLLESSYIQDNEQLHNRIVSLQKYLEQPKIMTYDDFVSSLKGDVYNTVTDISDVDYLLSRQLKEVVIIVDYPTRFATWTAKFKGNGTSFAINMLLPGTYGELCEGCERTNDVKLLQHKILMAKAQPIQWYVESVKKIKADRSGFGIGIDRLVRWVIGADQISQTRYFPRVKRED